MRGLCKHMLVGLAMIGQAGAVTLFHVDMFNASGAAGWGGVAGSSNVSFVATGGTGPVGDGLLRVASDGTKFGDNSPTPNGRATIINTSANWTGNYTAAGVTRIEFDVRNPNPGLGGGGGGPSLNGADVVLRLKLSGAGGDFGTVQSILVPAGTTNWTRVKFNLIPSNLEGDISANVTNTLAAVTELRISHTPNTLSNLPWVENAVETTLEFDNITASVIPEPSVALLLAAAGLIPLRRARRRG